MEMYRLSCGSQHTDQIRPSGSGASSPAEDEPYILLHVFLAGHDGALAHLEAHLRRLIVEKPSIGRVDPRSISSRTGMIRCAIAGMLRLLLWDWGGR